MLVRLEQVKVHTRGLQVEIEIRYRQGSWLKRLWVPWRWLATDDIMSALQAERDRQHRPLEDPVRPYLPLEKWE